MDLDDCPCSGKHLLKMVKPMLMATLARGEMHGYALQRELEGFGPALGGTPDLSGIYRTLKEMEERGFVSSSLDAGDSGPAKRLYRLTGDGFECLARWHETLRAYQRQLAAVNKCIEAAMSIAADKTLTGKGKRCDCGGNASRS